MSNGGDREIELFKKLTAQDIADNAEAIIKKRFAILFAAVAILSAAGGMGLVYQIMAAGIVEKQADAVKAIDKASVLSDTLRTSVAASIAALEKSRQDQEKLKVEAESNLSLIAEAKGQFELSRIQLADAQNKSAKSLEDLIAVLREQSSVIQSLLANPQISSALGGNSATQTKIDALTSALQKGETTVQQVREAAQNSRYTVFMHLSKAAVVPPFIENEIREWLIAAGYTVGGVVRDGSGSPRIDYFFSEDAKVAELIASHIREKYPNQFPAIQTKNDTAIRNSRGVLGLWL